MMSKRITGTLKEIEINWKTLGMWADQGAKYPIERDDVNEVLELVAEIRRLQKQNKRYREALEFYADEETYETKFATDTDEIYDPFTLIELDEGKKARQALEGEE